MTASVLLSPLSLGRLRPYAQLVRLPNVFTALADVALGALAVSALGWIPASGMGSYALLFLASACLYSGGMVWNDIFDVEQDERERPFRPLPSGRVSKSSAVKLGVVLLVLGILFALASGWHSTGINWLPGILAGVLTVAILLYDSWFKRFWAGPLGMGLCRFLNILMAFSLAGISPQGFCAALSVGIYIVGVTWFARTEARLSNRSSLMAAALVMLLGICLALPLGHGKLSEPSGSESSWLFPYLLVGLGFAVGIPVWRAIGEPIPSRVQAAVKRSIFGLVVLDSVLAMALAGTIGVVILLLLLPAMYLGRWIYST